MKITIEETLLDGSPNRAEVERNGESFTDLVNLFRDAALGLGFAPENVRELTIESEDLDRIKELEDANNRLAEQLDDVLRKLAERTNSEQVALKEPQAADF